MLTETIQITLSSKLATALAKLRNEFLAAANSYPELNLSLIMALHSAEQMLDGPPVELWRGDQPIVWSHDVCRADRTYRFCLWGGADGVKRFTSLLATAERCLDAIPDNTRGRLLGDCDRSLGWLGLVEHTALSEVTPLLYAARTTWHQNQLTPFDADGRVLLGQGTRRVREIYDGLPDYYITLIQPDVFAASAYAIDTLLGDTDAASHIVVVQSGGVALRKTPVSKKPRRRRSTRLTLKELAALQAFEDEGTYPAAALKLGITRQAVSKSVKSAKAKMGTASRSIKAKQDLPHDSRGQELVFDSQ